MLEKERLLKEYATAKNMWVNDGKFENIQLKGYVVQFTSNSKCKNYHDNHEIDLLDLLCWFKYG